MLRISLFILLFLSGCAKFDYFNPISSKPEESYMQATRKGELIFEDKTQIVAVITHLNAVDSEAYPSNKGEVFFVDVYQSSKETRSFLENDFKLRLGNGQIPLEINKVLKEELKGIMAKNSMRFGEYYFFRFAPQRKRERDNLSLVLSHPIFGESYLNFGFKAIEKK